MRERGKRREDEGGLLVCRKMREGGKVGEQIRMRARCWLSCIRGRMNETHTFTNIHLVGCTFLEGELLDISKLFLSFNWLKDMSSNQCQKYAEDMAVYYYDNSLHICTVRKTILQTFGK